MKIAGNIRVFPDPEAAALFLRRSSFKPHYERGRFLGWKRIDPASHHMISATTEVLPSGKVRVIRKVVSRERSMV